MNSRSVAKAPRPTYVVLNVATKRTDVHSAETSVGLMFEARNCPSVFLNLFLFFFRNCRLKQIAKLFSFQAFWMGWIRSLVWLCTKYWAPRSSEPIVSRKWMQTAVYVATMGLWCVDRCVLHSSLANSCSLHFGELGAFLFIDKKTSVQNINIFVSFAVFSFCIPNKLLILPQSVM